MPTTEYVTPSKSFSWSGVASPASIDSRRCPSEKGWATIDPVSGVTTLG